MKIGPLPWEDRPIQRATGYTDGPSITRPHVGQAYQPLYEGSYHPLQFGRMGCCFYKSESTKSDRHSNYTTLRAG